MLEILLNWLLIAIVSYGFGTMITPLMVRISLPSISSFIFSSFIGLLFITVVLSIVHFWIPLTSPFLLAIICVVGAIGYSWMPPKSFRISNPKFLFLFFLVILIAIWIKSAGPIGSLDTGSYHLPYIKWLEQYPIVHGLNNLHARFGFNYHYHLLVAFFGLDTLAGTTIHGMNGYMFIAIALFLMDLIRKYANTFEVLFYGVELLFLCQINNGMNSFSPDFPIASFQILILTTSFFAYRRQIFPYFYILLLGMSIATIPLKLSGFTLVFVLIFLIERKYITWTNFRKLLLVTLMVMIPYFIRNYYLSGYLIYPMSEIDLFAPAWKSSAHFAELERVIVRNYALGIPLDYTGQVHYNTDVIKHWINTIAGYNRASVYAVYLFALFIIFSLVFCVMTIIRKRIDHYFYCRLMAGLNLALLIAFYLGPDPRFVYGYLVVYAGIVSYLSYITLLCKLKFPIWIGSFIVITAALVMMMSTINMSVSKVAQHEKLSKVSWMLQTAYPSTDARKQSYENTTIYISPSGYGCWECPLPCCYTQDKFIIVDPHDLSKGFLPSPDKSEK